MTQIAQSKRMLVALVATAMLFAQVFLSAGTAGAAPQLDAFGNPLCITSHEQDGQPAGDHSGMPDCCASGCSMATTLLPLPPDGAVAIHGALASCGACIGFADDIVVAAPGYDPGSPRAPPATI